jgi:hypothetical protein
MNQNRICLNKTSENKTCPNIICSNEISPIKTCTIIICSNKISQIRISPNKINWNRACNLDNGIKLNKS